MKTHVHFDETTTISVPAPEWTRHLSKQQKRLWHDAVAHAVVHLANDPTGLPDAASSVELSDQHPTQIGFMA